MDNKKWQEIRKAAKQKTMNDLASQISSLTSLSEDKIKEITPTIDNPEKLQEIMKIVNDAAKTDEQKTEAIRAIDGAAKVISKLLGIGL